MIVPGGQSSSAPAPEARSIGQQLVAVPTETKLSAGATQTARPSGSSSVPLRNFQQPKAKRPNPAIKIVKISAVFVVLGAAAWFGWPFVKPHLPFLKPAGEESSVAATGGGDGSVTVTTEAATPPPPKEVPMTAPTHTLDISNAIISEGKVNGSIAGTNFVPDTVRIDRVAGLVVLDLRQGSGVTPDRGMRVYLRLNPADSPAGQSWTVSQDMKGTAVSRVAKVWKTNPKYAAQEKSFTTGFALKLEFGQLTGSNTIPGKIYAALPDKELTVVGGVFNATSTLGSTPGTPAVPQPVANPQLDTGSAEFRRRYGNGQ